MVAVDKSELERWRRLDAVVVLVAIAEHAKQDATFVPTKDPRTTRWHATVGGHDVELLMTGPKFWDPHRNAGGGGAIDLLQHLCGAKFKAAAQRLRALDL